MIADFDYLIRLTCGSISLLIYQEVIMFESVEEKKSGFPWGVIAGVLAFGALLAAGYFVVT